MFFIAFLGSLPPAAPQYVTVTAPSCLEQVSGKAPLLLFISQGGNSTNTIAAIESHRDVPSLALTGNPDGEINTLCDHAVFIPCGEIVAALQTSANQMPENIRRVQVWETANIDTLKKIHTTYLIGKQQDALVAAEGALKLMETILVPAFSFDFNVDLRSFMAFQAIPTRQILLVSTLYTGFCSLIRHRQCFITYFVSHCKASICATVQKV